ncbi:MULTISPECIES: alpha-N-acetylglucosaminidase TIM-barrel domain-containing protein [unclassified Clostridium]|uniref:alpha-N-acetylglucosaminidase TIM-barrel domain-containing protein n=1 Tax=unclassified Clostridium TaxID=2614128 RepID=UPI001C8BC1AD|nr:MULTISPECIES: alpha-N-acetylglucosaminidase TIM-barrel domain-containing protein [unclassified Clostridium]MBX9138888.1 LPXTG cell wall anchor domain-containing protein [Clostridium sp. K12(2020)]MBX9145679.1 LPXTG cell wall anchor domain-containing protein [Clostridium sp. K13]MDU2291335.1 alpha-N-acetylglucosaminidase TIM-barrel domain-containing protein [Clostridium celatum]
MRNKIKVNIARALAVTCVAGLTVSIPVEVKAGTNDSISKGVTITAKSNTNNHSVNLAMDGDKETYWESSNHYRWVEIDLGATYNLSSIKVFNKIGGYYHYNIYASSDGENFIKIGAKENNDLATIDGDIHNTGNVKVNKIRIDVTFSSNNDNSNIAEIELYGKKVSDEVAKETAIETTDFAGSKWETEYNKFTTDTSYADSKTVSEMTNMVGRVIGDEYKDNFIFEMRSATSTGNDVFEVEDGADGKIVIRGNNGVSLASGFNYYLKNYAKVMYNPMMGSNLNMPETMPSVGEKIVIDTPYEERYSLNFCTYSYTMSFWDWNEYEAFLDWSAMNGFNLMLDIIGQEEVLRRTLNEFGYSDEEVKEFISGPAYFAWFYMQNMTSFGGPLPDNWFEERAELGRQLHDRMQTLGIKPVLQGYSGMVPLDFQSKNPDAQILPQGDWCGFDRPNMLKTYVNEGEKDYFQEVADVFYEKQKEVYGDITDYYAVDPFHEGGNTGGMNSAKIYGTIQDKMIEHDNNAIWVIQHWQGNPDNTKLSGLTNKEQALILDLNSDLNPDYKRFDNQDIPWVWNMLHNFGGRMGLDGQVETVATSIPDALANTEHMKGIGITPEAINNSPIVYELIGDMVWTRDPINYREWVNNYIERRYGAVNEDAIAAWEILLETAYKKSDYYYQGAAESVINARPAMSINSASTWGHSKIPYNKKELEKAMELFISCYDDLKGSDAFVYDFLDITKQVLANSAQEYHKEMVAAYNAGDSEKFDKISTHFLDLIRLQERVLSTSPEFLVGTWIEQSRTMLEGADDWTKDLFEFNARALITTWGDYKNGGLKDYSNRQWAGLTGDLYLKRWEMWVDGISNELKTGKPAPGINWYRVEYEWANEKTTEENQYTTEGSGEDLAMLANIAMDEFSVTNMEKFLGGSSSAVEKVNIALGKTVTSSVESKEGNPTSNLTDGTTGTAWMANGVTWPVELTLDLEKEYSVDGIAFAPNQAAGGFPINYVVEVRENGEWKEVARQDEGTITGTISIDYKGIADQVKLTINSDNNLLVPEMTEIMVYQGQEEGEKVEYDNIALGKPATATSEQAGKPASNVTDGDLGTIWVSNGEGIGSDINVDLLGSEFVEKLEVSFEKAGLPFQFKVDVENADGTTSTVLDMTGNDKPVDKTYTIAINKEIRDVTVTITGKNGQGQWPGAWAGLAEIKALRPAQSQEELVNVALGKSVTGSNSEGGRPLTNLVDGNTSTLWIAANGAPDAWANVNLGKEYFAENVEVVFEKAGLPFKFKVEAIDANGNSTVILDKTNNNQVLEKAYTIPVKNNVKDIKVTFNGKAAVGDAQGAWSALAEIKVNSKSTPNQGVTASVKIPQQNMSIEASSEHPNVGNEGLASFAIDGNKDTIWHTKYGSGFTQLPHDITINLGKEYTINKYSYLPRSGSSNGNITKYEIQVSTDGQSFKTVASGNWDNNSNEKVVQFDNVQATHVRLVALEGIAGFATAAELNVYSIPDNIAINESTTVSANVNNEAINNVKDNNLETAWEASAAEDKVVTFDLGSTKDISAIEILKSSNEALKYKVEYSKDGETWISIADRSKNDKDYNNYVEEIDGGIIAKYIKLTFLNNDVKIDEVKLYKGDSTQPLVNYISVVQGIYNSAVVGDMAGNYPQEAKDTLGAAIEKAKAELDKDPDSVRVQELVQELKTAVSNFRNQAVKINRIKLAVLIDEVDAVLNSLNTERLAELTEEQRNVVESAIEELKVQKASAITVYETVKVGQSQIDGAYDSLKVAFDNYLEVADEQAKYEAALAIAKETVGNAVVGSGNGQYTQEAVEALNAAIDKAEADFANVTDITEIATIVEELNSEVETFKSSVIIVNITELEAAIVDAEEALSNAEGINTPNAIAEFTTAVETAKSVLTNTNASQVEVDEAVEALKTAKAKFDEALVVDKADLNKLIENAGEAINKLNKYSGTEKLVAKMEAAVLEAKVIANDANVTKDVVDAASGKLVDLIAEANEKLAELENGIFKTHLIITVEEANKVTEAELSKVVPVVVTEFKAALAEAQGLLANSNATQEQIDASFTRLSKAMQMLSFEKGDKQYLIALVERIDTLDGNNYIKSTWDKLQGVVAIANGVIADENALEAEVTETYTNLIRSFLELRLKPNKDALNDLINKMESLDSSKYTSETWAVLEAELANAKNILANEEATSEDVDNAEKALRTAFDGLLANATDDNNGSGNNGNNGNSGNGNGNKPSEKPQKPGKPGNDSSLPKTGGASSALAVVFGGILAAGGALLGRKNKKK